MTNSAKLTFKYNDETTRNYELSVEADDMIDVEDNVKAINVSLAAGTDNGMSSFFVSKAGASLAEISAAQLISVTETVLDLGGNN